MKMKDHPIKMENHLPNLHFWVPCSVSRVYACLIFIDMFDVHDTSHFLSIKARASGSWRKHLLDCGPWFFESDAQKKRLLHGNSRTKKESRTLWMSALF